MKRRRVGLEEIFDPGMCFDNSCTLHGCRRGANALSATGTLQLMSLGALQPSITSPRRCQVGIQSLSLSKPHPITGPTDATKEGMMKK